MKLIHTLAAIAASLFAFVPAQAGVVTYSANLLGSNESPANASPGSGTVSVVYDYLAHTLHVTATFADLIGITTAAHIHCCASPGVNAGVATTTPTFADFPLGVTSGLYDKVLDLTLASSYRPAFITANGGIPAGAEAALASGLAAGEAYFNIHTTFATGGELRGNLAAVPVPEPASLSLAALALAALALRRRRV